MENGWIKHFVDHTSEIGTNRCIQNKLASWSRGRLQGIWSVCLKEDEHHVHIQGNGYYWQSDDFEVCLPEKWPTMVTRRIQRRLDPGDIFFDVKRFGDHSLEVYVGQAINLENPVRGKRIMLTDADIGKWLTLEIDLINKTERYYLAENKI